MEEHKYSITLSDGSIISGLTLNGNSYISKTEINKKQFAGNLSSVKISDGIDTNIYANMELVQINKYDNEWWFILRELTEKEVADRKLRADVDFISMMTDIEL